MRSFVQQIFRKVIHGRSIPIKIVFADNSSYQNHDAEIEITIEFKTKRSEWRTALFGYVGFFESYFEQEIDILGEYAVGMLIRMAYANSYKYTANPLISIRRRNLERLQDNRVYSNAKVNARQHYGLPTALFKAILGTTMCYAEGYWSEKAKTLEEAQHERCDYICRKLQIKPGDQMVEVGSGWGYMSILAAEKYQAKVVNYGLVPEQNLVMQQRLNARNLEQQIKVVEKDHRELLLEPNTYDKYVSVGIYEHAGINCHRKWLESIAVSLKPGGFGVLSSVTYMEHVPTEYLTIKYVFPGGQVPSLPRTLELMDECGLHVLDIEDLSAHYQRTAECWLENFNNRWPEIQASNPTIFNEKFRRVWNFYLSGVVENFRPGGGNLNLHHITFEKGKGHYPKTRDRLYVV